MFFPSLLFSLDTSFVSLRHDYPSFSRLPFADRSVLVFLTKHGSLGPSLLTSGWGTPAASSTEGYPVDSTHLHLHQSAASVLRMRGKSRIRVYLFVCTERIYTHTQSISHMSMWLKRCSFRFCSKCITMYSALMYFNLCSLQKIIIHRKTFIVNESIVWII